MPHCTSVHRCLRTELHAVALTARTRRVWRLPRAGPAALLLCLSCLLCSLPVCAPAQAASRATDAVLTETDAYLLLPPELICGPMVEQRTLSPQGRNVAVLRRAMRLSVENFPFAGREPRRPVEEQEIVFWNAQVRKPVSLWQSAQPGTRVALSEWMSGTESLFAVVDRELEPDPQRPGQPPRHDWKLLLLGLGIDRAFSVPLPAGDFHSVEVSMSPTHPLAVVHLYPVAGAQAHTYVLVHRNGRVGMQIQAPASVREGPSWNTLGEPLFASTEQIAGKNQRVFRSVDVRTGQLRVLPAAPDLYTAKPQPQAPPLPIRILTAPQSLAQAGSKERISPVWVEAVSKSQDSRVLLTADGSETRLLADGGGALFQASNSLWFTPIIKLNKAEYLAARAAAQRMTALSNAKQLCLAAIMFAMDNDEVLPGPDGIEAKLMPYAKNGRLFEGFTYVYPGSTLADIASPSETILGFVTGPGGRAVLYADGHAKWSKEQP